MNWAKGSPEHIYQACLRKVAHMAPATAQREAKALRKRTGTSYGVYHCRYCQHYHVGRHRKPSNLTRFLKLKRIDTKP